MKSTSKRHTRKIKSPNGDKWQMHSFKYTWQPPTKEDIKKQEEEKKNMQHRELKEIAIFLEGMYKGSGNIYPLGKSHIESLWNAVRDIK